MSLMKKIGPKTKKKMDDLERILVNGLKAHARERMFLDSCEDLLKKHIKIAPNVFMHCSFLLKTENLRSYLLFIKDFENLGFEEYEP